MNRCIRPIRKTRHTLGELGKRDVGPSFSNSLLSWYARQKAQNRNDHPAVCNVASDPKQS